MKLEELVEQEREDGREPGGHAYRIHPEYGGTDQWRPGQSAFYMSEPGIVVGTATSPEEHECLWSSHPNLEGYDKRPFTGPYIAWKSERGQLYLIPFDPNDPESVPLQTAMDVGRST